MKVYIVTAGAYSDYHIEKVFTDPDKAKEYQRWCYDANDIEEYETEDNETFKKYYRIDIEYRIDGNGRNGDPKVSITQHVDDGWLDNNTRVVDWRKYHGSSIEIGITRYIAEENWNKEFYVNKYTKAIYDLAAQAKQLLSEGWTDQQIAEMWNSKLDY